MNKSLRQLFTAVLVLFVVLGISSSIIMTVQSNSLSHDARNTRSLYHMYGAPRGAILASDGTVLAKSDPVNDAFSYQRSYANGALYAPVTGYFSVTQNADRGIEASENDLLTGESNALFWQDGYQGPDPPPTERGAGADGGKALPGRPDIPLAAPRWRRACPRQGVLADDGYFLCPCGEAGPKVLHKQPIHPAQAGLQAGWNRKVSAGAL